MGGRFRSESVVGFKSELLVGLDRIPQLRQMLKEKGIVLIAPRTTKCQPGPHPGGGLVALKEDHAIRAKVERKQAELVKYHGLRVARYIGLAKVKLQAYFTAAAVNIKRLGLLVVNATCG